MNASADFMAANSLVWPLTVILIALFIVQKAQEDVRPLVRGVVSGLTGQATRNAAAWAMALLMATAASCQALGEVATDMGWAYVAAGAKVLQPGLVAVIAYVTKAPGQSANTTPPFAPQSPPTP